jgi:hypothetical protein
VTVTTGLAILGSLGGIAAFFGAFGVVVRAIFRQVSATEDNTAALNRLEVTVTKLDTQQGDLAHRVTVLEARRPA